MTSIFFNFFNMFHNWCRSFPPFLHHPPPAPCSLLTLPFCFLFINFNNIISSNTIITPNYITQSCHGSLFFNPKKSCFLPPTKISKTLNVLMSFAFPCGKKRSTYITAISIPKQTIILTIFLLILSNSFTNKFLIFYSN